MDGCPLFHWKPDLAHLSRSPVRMGAFASVDARPLRMLGCAGSHESRGLGRFAPDQLTSVRPSTLQARQENAIITQAPHDLLATSQSGKPFKDQFDRSLHLDIGGFAHPPVL